MHAQYSPAVRMHTAPGPKWARPGTHPAAPSGPSLQQRQTTSAGFFNAHSNAQKPESSHGRNQLGGPIWTLTHAREKAKEAVSGWFDGGDVLAY